MNSVQPAGRTPDDQLPDEATPVAAASPGASGPSGTPAAAGRDDDANQGTDQMVPAAIRAQRSTKDIVMSLLVLLLPIALLIGFGRVFFGTDQATVVNPASAIQEARAANAFPVSEPTGLDDGWRTVRAGFTRGDSGATLRIGYLSPDDGGMQLVQSNIPAQQLLPAELTRNGQPKGSVEVGGRNWQLYGARADELALVLLEPDRTVIVIGRVPESDLRRIATSLR